MAGINECGEGTKSENFEVTVDNTVGIVDPGYAGEGIVIAPNPSSGIFHLSISEDSGERVSLGIYSLIGKQIYQEDLKVNGEVRKTLDLSAWPDGIYFLVIEKHNGFISKKIVKH
jgi:hypothetical protein